MNRLGISLVSLTASSNANNEGEPQSKLLATTISNKENHIIAQNIVNQLNTSGSTSSGVVRMEQFNKNVSQATEILKASHIICFDVDSTVIKEEGIDELAKFCGKGQEVQELTKEAMGGAMSFEQALTRRLNIIRPTQAQIRDFLKLHPSTITPGVRDLINKFKSEGKQVFLITGGFDCLINPVALELGIPLENVYANKLHFTYTGDYVAFDVHQPTSHSGGKGEAISMIRKRFGNERKLITMVGDGATDMEASPPADYFIGFGGNVVRDSVYKGAQFYVTDFKQLLW